MANYNNNKTAGYIDADGKEIKTESDKIQCYIDDIEDFYNGFNDYIYRARNILTFLYVDQWDYQVRINREAVGKPTLSFNQLVPMLRAICGEQRDNTPALAVRDISTNFKVPQQQIDDLTDLLREIFYRSDADIVFQIAFKQMLECGWGTCHVRTKYENNEDFRQCIYIEPVVDFQAAFWDRRAQLPDKSDGDFCGVYQIISREQFRREYPDIEEPESLTTNGDYYLPWVDEDAVVIGEIYRKEYFTKTLVELSHGKTLEKKDADKLLKMQDKALEEHPHLEDLGYQRIEVAKDENGNDKIRKLVDYKMKHVKFIQNAMLEETNYPGKILPLPYGEGDSTVIDGQRIPLPYVQESIDAQKLINYIGSEIAYAIVRSRKETIIGTETNFEGNPDVWQNPEQVQGALTYKVDSSGNKPEFINPPIFNPVLLQTYGNFIGEIQRTTGYNNEAQGIETNAHTEGAIAMRQSASRLPVNVYQDNLKRLIKNVGSIILDLAPHIIDNEQTVIVRGHDNNTRQVTFNKRSGMRMNADGELEDVISNNLKDGKYDIEVRVDGNFDEQRAAALDFLLKLAAVNPAVGNLIPDMIAENSGLEQSQKLIERFKTLIPPQILAKEEGKPPPPPPPPPPSPPEIIVAQIKSQNELKIAQMKQASEIAKIQMEAQLKGGDYKTTYYQALADITKANAEVIKSNNAVKESALDHSATVQEAHSDFAQSLINAEIKRATLDAQSKTLRGMDI